MTLKEQLIEYVDEMLTRPQMFGSTTEVIEFQFILLMQIIIFLEDQTPLQETLNSYKQFIHKQVHGIGCRYLSGYFGNDKFEEVVRLLQLYKRMSSKG